MYILYAGGYQAIGGEGVGTSPLWWVDACNISTNLSPQVAIRMGSDLFRNDTNDTGFRMSFLQPFGKCLITPIGRNRHLT